MKTIICIIFAALALLPVCSVVHAEQATSVNQWGITWTFDKPATVGKFVNGDWWVLGPVTMVKVDPQGTFFQPGGSGLTTSAKALTPEQIAQIKPIAYNPWPCDFRVFVN